MIRIQRSIHATFGMLLCAVAAIAAPPAANQKQLKEPVYRVAKKVDQKAVREKQNAHPIDACLDVAYKALAYSQENIVGYSGTVIKQETLDGKLTVAETMFIKVRNRKERNGKITTPLSLYLNYLKPKGKKGQEAIWIEGKNNNKLIAHGTGIQGFVKINLDPDGTIAKIGTNYAIYDLGIENLILKLIDRAEGEKKTAKKDVQVQFYKDAKINGRVCTLMQVTHPVKREGMDFHIARIFIDDELKLPVRYAAYNWPNKEGGKLVLIEQFTYFNVNTDVKLTDKDFDPDNPKYNYP